MIKHSSICSSHLIVDTTDVLHDIQHKAWSHKERLGSNGCISWLCPMDILWGNYGEIMGRLYYIILYYIILYYIYIYNTNMSSLMDCV